MSGLSRYTGKLIDDFESVKQSIDDILSTPKGSRVMRRDYGSDLHKYIDSPLNKSNIAKIYLSVVQAITDFEPRVSLEKNKINVSADETGHLIIGFEFIYKPKGTKHTIRGVKI
ncbi:GPW/gp25 family protein [Francisella sp. SYW-9]|uniref:GPW/gp25 family protein n=1 Tax=Francisella sp. SYW-9 TaxID=2610888 RepID=UPI00123DF983|nr:GPW/gp25 family protein [Francisella sp. SYW-9]